MEEHIHNNNPLSLLLYLSLFFSLFLITTTLSQSSNESSIFSVCNRPFNCGALSNISFPFWDDVERPRYCGGRNEFKLTNCSLLLPNQHPSLQISSQDFIVIDINPFDYTIKMRLDRNESTYETCEPPLSNITLDKTLFQYTPDIYTIIAFYHCTNDVVLTNNFTCYYSSDGYKNENVFYMEDDARLLRTHQNLFQKCKNHSLLLAMKDAPLDPNPGADGGIGDLMRVVEGGFEVKYDNIIEDVEKCKKCRESKGVCGRSTGNNDDKYRFSCYCPDGSTSLLSSCPNNNSSFVLKLIGKVIIGVTAGITGLSIGIITCLRCKSSTWKVRFWLTTEDDQDIEAFLKNHGALSLKRYKFSEVKKMANSFKDKLGQGGFGTVYKGKLPTGCPVAVKILKATKKNGADFINEVASISRTSHINVVTLLGFCFEGNKKALIYEFMPNGSLDKFIYQKGHETTPSLSFDNLYEIALGIARGLEYLHRGCNTRILHFDIKPHNILLDDNLCPKISDFGLAKLCPRKESIISMSNARGTIGYLAPEMWNRHFGGVSHKSDVYSYGMMLLEMTGGRKNINPEGSHSSEIYFPHWIYKRLETSNTLGADDGVAATEEDEIVKKMTLVGLWCIQTIPNDRPAISKVIDMLEGDMNSLQVPPKPVLSSPPRSIPECTTTFSSTT